MITFRNCLDMGLLRRIPPSTEKAKQSLEKARELLGEAKGNLMEERYNTVVIISYLSIFNAARSLLFKDGFRERSHACVARYLEEKYKKEIPKTMIRILDRYRTSRHNTQYDVAYYSSKDEAEGILKFSKEFIERVENILDD